MEKVKKERSINHALREKILSLNPEELRAEFFRPDEGIRIFHMNRKIIMDLAEEASALYKIGRFCIYHRWQWWHW